MDLSPVGGQVETYQIVRCGRVRIGGFNLPSLSFRIGIKMNEEEELNKTRVEEALEKHFWQVV